VHLPWRPVSPGPGLPGILTSLLADEAGRLAGLAAGGGRILEIGSANGYSAVVMALAGGQVTAVDPHTGIPGSQQQMRAALAAAGAGNQVTIVAGYSQDIMPRLPAGFRLVFIDGDHTAAAVSHDITQAARLLAPGGTLAVHDYGEDCCCPDVRPVVDRLYPGRGTVTGTLWEMTL
jgi:protein-L-isoaspartate O-methyltransferase